MMNQHLAVLPYFLAATLTMAALFFVTTVSADAIEDIYAGIDARKRGEYDESIRFYSRALESEGLSQNNRAVALNNRCNTYNDIGQYDLAISDCNEAIRLQPDSAPQFNNRGNSYTHKGQYDRAIEDYNEAIRLKPDFVLAISSRGLSYYYKGQYDRAEKDFGRSVELNPKYPYAVLRLYFTKQRLDVHDKAQLTELATRLDLKEWPGPLVQLYLDKITPEDVLAMARHNKPKKDGEQRCEATFYIAEYHLGKGNRTAALTQFRAAEEICKPHGFTEYYGAKAELKRLGEMSRK